MAAESASEAEQASTTEATEAEAETGPADGPGSPEVQAEVVERVESPEASVSEDPIGSEASDEFRSNGLLQAAASTTETAATTTTTAGLVTEEAAPNTRFPEVLGTDNQLHHPDSFQEDPIKNDPTVNVPIQQSRKNPMIPIQAYPVGSNPSLLLGRLRYVLLGPYQTVRVVFCNPIFLGTKCFHQLLDF